MTEALEFVPILRVLAGSSFGVAVLVVILSLRRARLSRNGNRPTYLAATVIAGLGAFACLLVIAGFSGPFAAVGVYLGAVSLPVWMVVRNLATDKVRNSTRGRPSPTSRA